MNPRMARISAVVRRVAGELLDDDDEEEEAAAVLSDAESWWGRCKDDDGAPAAVSALPVWISPLLVRLRRWRVEDKMAARAEKAGSGAEALALE